jgi:hypothetical protein
MERYWSEKTGPRETEETGVPAHFRTLAGKISLMVDLPLIAGNSADISKANFENRIASSNHSPSATHKYLF